MFGSLNISKKYCHRQCAHCGQTAEKSLHRSQYSPGEGINVIPNIDGTLLSRFVGEDKSTYLHTCKCTSFPGKFTNYNGFNEYVKGNVLLSVTFVYSDMSITAHYEGNSITNGVTRVAELQWIPSHTDYPNGFYFAMDAFIIHTAKDFSGMNGEQIHEWARKIKVMT